MKPRPILGQEFRQVLNNTNGGCGSFNFAWQTVEKSVKNI
jgi:hypothetical protein